MGAARKANIQGEPSKTKHRYNASDRRLFVVLAAEGTQWQVASHESVMFW
jgi:hypothetical protein